MSTSGDIKVFLKKVKNKKYQIIKIHSPGIGVIHA